MGLLRRVRKDDVDVQSCLANLGRLEALDAAGLDRDGVRRTLDGLVELAAGQLRAPMAFMSLVGSRTVFVAGAFGLEGEIAETRTNTVEATYCQYVVALDDVLVISDSTADSLVDTHPATLEGGVRAYLGVPLRYEGQCLGSFCVVDTQPRHWTDEDLDVLRALSDEALNHVR